VIATSTSTNDRPGRSREERDVGQLEHPAERLAASGGSRSIAPGAQDLGCAFDRPQEGPGVDLGDREQLELDRRHRRDVPASATERPEELRLRVPVRPDEAAVGGDDIGRDDRVAGQPERPDHPAEAAPERVAEHADVRGRAGEIRETVLARRDGQRPRERTGLDMCAMPPRVDRDPVHALGLEEQRVAAPVDRARVVAAGVERDPQAALGGKADGGDHVARGLRVHDGDGPLVGREVPRLPRGLPRLVARQDDVADEPVIESTEFHGRPPVGRRGQGSRHRRRRDARRPDRTARNP
jgi:hypothetical protein